MIKKLFLVFSTILALIWLYYFRYSIIYPGVSKIKIISPSSNMASEFTIPNEMVSKYRNPPVFGEVKSILLDLEPGLTWARGPKYSLSLEANGNNNSIVTITLPNLIATMNEIESNFMGYKKYIRETRGNITTFMLVAQNKTKDPIFIQCHQGYMQQLQKCTYYGTYDDKLSYQFSFPGEEIPNLDKLILYAKNKIFTLLDKK